MYSSLRRCTQSLPPSPVFGPHSTSYDSDVFCIFSPVIYFSCSFCLCEAGLSESSTWSGCGLYINHLALVSIGAFHIYWRPKGERYGCESKSMAWIPCDIVWDLALQTKQFSEFFLILLFLAVSSCCENNCACKKKRDSLFTQPNAC